MPKFPKLDNEIQADIEALVDLHHARFKNPTALWNDIKGDWTYWERFDTAFIRACSKLVVAKMDGWKESVGVQAEIKIAESLGLPVEYLEV